MGKKYPMVFALGLCVLCSLAASPTFARNVLGGDSDAAAEEKADNEKASEAENAQSTAEKEAAEKKRKEAEEKRLKKEEAERKAEQEAKEAALKKAAEVEKRKQEAELKAKRKQREKRENLLKSVKSNRHYARIVEGHRALVSVTPGGSKKNKVIEVTFQVFAPKESAMAETKIVSKLKSAIATVTTSKKRKRGGEHYKLHRISRAGTYGFHYTPTMNGTYNVEIKGTTPNGTEIAFDIPLYIGAWPPPDFPAEEEAYQAATQGTGKSRRVMDTE